MGDAVCFNLLWLRSLFDWRNHNLVRCNQPLAAGLRRASAGLAPIRGRKSFIRSRAMESSEDHDCNRIGDVGGGNIDLSGRYESKEGNRKFCILVFCTGAGGTPGVVYYCSATVER